MTENASPKLQKRALLTLEKLPSLQTFNPRLMKPDKVTKPGRKFELNLSASPKQVPNQKTQVVPKIFKINTSPKTESQSPKSRTKLKSIVPSPGSPRSKKLIEGLSQVSSNKATFLIRPQPVSQSADRHIMSRSSVADSVDSEGGSCYNIWDNTRLKQVGIDVDRMQCFSDTQKILKLYKMRFSQFPQQEEEIKNDRVVNQVKSLVRNNPQLQRKYFNVFSQSFFDDPYDYSKLPYRGNDTVVE